MLAMGPGKELCATCLIWPYYCLPQICDRPYTFFSSHSYALSNPILTLLHPSEVSYIEKRSKAYDLRLALPILPIQIKKFILHELILNIEGFQNVEIC